MRLSRTRTQTQTSPAYRLQLGLTLVLALATVAVFVVYLLLALNWKSQPFIGVMLNNTLSVNRGVAAGTDDWVGIDAGMVAGDRLTRVNGVALPEDYAVARSILQEVRQSLRIGENINVEYSRGGEVQTATYPVGYFPDTDFFVFFAIPYMSGLIVMAFGLGLLRYRYDQLSGLVAANLCFCLAVFMGGLFDLGTSMALGRFWLLMTVLGGGTCVAIGMLFPNPLNITYRFSWVHLIPIGVSLLVSAVVVLLYDTGAPSSATSGSREAVNLFIAGAFIMAGLVFYQRQRATSRLVRNQSTLVLLGLGLATIPALLWIFSQSLQYREMTISLEAMMPFLVTPVIGIAIAIFQIPRIEGDTLVTQGVTYSILMAALVAGYFLLTLGASLLTQEFLPDNPLLIALTLFVIAVLFIPVRTWLQGRIDNIYFRRRNRYESVVENFNREIGMLTNNNTTIQVFRKVIDETLAPENTFLFLPNSKGSGEFVAYGEKAPETDMVFAPESGVVELLKREGGVYYIDPNKPLERELMIDRARLSILKSAVLGAIKTSNTLNGIVSIGRARSGKSYTHEDLRFIENVVAGLSVAIERAQDIEVLQRRVQELDVLSQVGQAVNFTIEFDDLLELISTRTSRLIDSSHFYIALYEQPTNQMYFAFYLENDERYDDKEGKRWKLGNDLFSEIVRTGQPRRVDDYSKATSEGGYELLFDNRAVKAWMGVPLIAGPNTLGTMAVGKSKQGDPYTQEQLRIFSSIGALAATSIDKARLFAEVNVRARQLAALNDISQKLVLAEAGEVEALLKLITSSAVEILNAEAGSLLLSAEDDSSDMIFRVVIGGTGSELLGKRIPSTHGMIGEVVRKGQPVISNDIKSEASWKGDLAQGFSSEAILAVPLTAKDRIIGVLEVLNKKDRTPFVKEEVELLTTFAGQAAIAIENARLFQMTGSQLNKRLEELETLERIDFELNRTLDLQRVAEITVRWAVASSGAVAGALGLVEEGQPFIRILATYGYRPEEFPEGAEEKRWPADRGIVKRVMRTRQPDLADTRIDPDYVPSLKGTISQITVPMMSGGELNAMLILETNKEPRFNLLDLSFVQRIAEHASVAVANAQLLKELQFAAESKSEFVGFAAHELKTPLTNIKGWSAMLNSSMASSMSDEMRTNALEVIATNANKMQNLIDDLRDVAALDANKLKMEIAPMQFAEVVEETLASLMPRFDEKEQTVNNLVSSSVPMVLGDHKRLGQVMTNLLTNANKYSEEGTTITIRADVNRNFRTKQGQSLGAVLHVKVIDQGIGLDEKDLSRLFREDYFRSDNEKAQMQKGTGLGMMITQRFIESHGGKIWVESQLNVGSTFQFVIPLAPEAPAPDPVQFEDYKAPTQLSNGRRAESLPEHEPSAD
jgi:signal transduction histidine kinase